MDTSTDAKALASLQAFANGINADPPRYQLSVVDAATIASSVSDYVAAWGVATNPATRNAGTVNAKDQLRNAAIQVCRQYAILIKYNAGISDQDKIDIGVTPVNPTRNPINCPGTSPILAVIAATPGAQTVRYADSMTPDSGRKPFGASELLLFVAVAETAANSYEEAKFYGKFTRNPIAVLFGPGDNGKQATYFGRWASRRGEMGPFSAPVTLAIAA